MKTDNYLRRLRDEDFMQACRRVISATKGNLTEADVAARAAAGPAPAYYVSFDYALRRLRGMGRGKERLRCPASRRRMEEIAERVERMMRRHGISDSEALQRVLAEGRASSFFLSAGSARRFYQNARQRRKNNRLWKTPQ